MAILTIPSTPICICICMCICIYICICICICNSFAKEKFANAISNFHSFETLPLFQFPFESFDFYPLKDLVFNWKLNVKTLSWPATPYFNLLWTRLEKKRFCNPIWIIWLKILRKRLYHDLQHLISKQFAGDRAQPHDTISSNSADDRKRQIVDQDHQLALPWRACNHSPEIGSGLNCIGNNCDPLKALCFRPHNTCRRRLGRYSPEIFNPCLQPSS